MGTTLACEAFDAGYLSAFFTPGTDSRYSTKAVYLRTRTPAQDETRRCGLAAAV